MQQEKVALILVESTIIDSKKPILDELHKNDIYDVYFYSVYNNIGHKKDFLDQNTKNNIKIELTKTILTTSPLLTMSVGRVPTEELLQKSVKGLFYDVINKILYSSEYNIWFIPVLHPIRSQKNEFEAVLFYDGIKFFCEVYKELCNKNRI